MVRHSATLAINERLEGLRKAGKSVLHLGFGEAGLPVLPQVGQVLAEAANRNSYGSVTGSERARTAAAGYFTRRNLPTTADQVLLAPGSKALLFGLLATLPGDIVLPRPSWVSYGAQAALVGKKVIDVPIPAEAGGVPDPEQLEASLNDARGQGSRPGILIVTLPDNPTGTLPSPETVTAVCRVAERHGLVVISDEIYRDLRTAERFRSPAEVIPERSVITSGLSKNMALGGYRIGFARLPSGDTGESLADQLTGVASEVWSSLSAPMQEVAAWVLDEPDEVTAHLEASRTLHATVGTAVHDVFVRAGAICRAPQGPFYLYPDLEPLRPAIAGLGVTNGRALAEHLLDAHGIGVLAGAEFGDQEEALRMRVATSLLYGDTEEQRWQALASSDPVSLSWIRSALEFLEEALSSLRK